MTHVQILLPFATFVGTLAVVVVGFLYNNSRITDLRTDMNNRFADMNNRFGDFEKLFDAKLVRLKKRCCFTNSRNSTIASCVSKID